METVLSHSGGSPGAILGVICLKCVFTHSDSLLQGPRVHEAPAETLGRRLLTLKGFGARRYISEEGGSDGARTRFCACSERHAGLVRGWQVSEVREGRAGISTQTSRVEQRLVRRRRERIAVGS